MELQLLLLLMFPLLIVAGRFNPWPPTFGERVTPPWIIAHRGDKVQMPEHTLGGYLLAMIAKVDFVEPDLVLTKDLVLVCHHDITLSGTTDVSSRPEFAHLMVASRTLLLDGQNVTFTDEWFVSDFTLEELQTLFVVQAQVGIRPQFFNHLFAIPTFQQYLDAVHDYTLKLIELNHGNWTIGIIPELKNPTYHDKFFPGSHGMATLLLATLQCNGYPTTPLAPHQNCTSGGGGGVKEIPCPPAIIQCFDIDTIAHLHSVTNIPSLALLDSTQPRYLTYKGFQELSYITEYIGIWKELLFTGTLAEIGDNYDHQEIGALGGFIPPNKIVDQAHRLGMRVVVYTIYDSEEPSLRGCDVQCTNDTKKEELEFYFRLGVDAFFVEGLCETLLIRDQYYSNNNVRSHHHHPKLAHQRFYKSQKPE